MMSRRTRALVFMLGLALMVFSLAALAYAILPIETVRSSATLAPTVFTLPAGGPP
jgi:hypothetical protein